jgi:hypothetical protein
MAPEKAPEGVKRPPIPLTEIMRQPWPPQSQNGFCNLFARVKFPKFLFLKPIPYQHQRSLDSTVFYEFVKQAIKGKRFVF